MASLYTGNYGMSQNCMDEGKEYFFVKLTDSAYRAIEEYQKNQNKCGTHATIQIIANGGVLSFPTPNGNVGQKFSFSVDDVDGSIECIEQNQNQLEVLGTLPNKMRIHANEDVYEATKHRMAVAEETQKNKCTREIKPNQTDIGRKVKVKTTIPPVNNQRERPSNALPKRDHSSSRSPSTTGGNSISPIPSLGTSSSSASLINKSSISSNNYCSPNNTQMPTNASTLSSALSSAAGSGTSGINNGYFDKGGSAAADKGSSAILGGSNTNRNSSSNNQKIDNRQRSDVSKRKIRERLIHLLALKPFKKPELYARLQNEGIRDKEKNLITTILKEISTMRDNTYNLKRPMWNDVNEEWPFYSEQEVQMLKRRKPQNLTPLSSDGGSSTSGQSPTSTHNGSPTPAVKRPTHDRERERYYEDPMSKKQRISHFKKDKSNTITNSNKNHQESDDNSVDLSYGVLEGEFMPSTGVYRNKIKNCNNNNNKSPYINNNDDRKQQHHPQQSPSANTYNITTNDSESSGFSSSSLTGDDYNNHHHQHHQNQNQQPQVQHQLPIQRHQTSSPTIKGAMKNCNINSPTSNRDSHQNQQQRSITPTMNNFHSNDTGRSGRRTNNNLDMVNTAGQGHSAETAVVHDFSKFAKITSIEQRRLYKTEFEKDFAEYGKLLDQIQSVGKRFEELAQRLNSTRNDEDNYRNIKKEIVAEYARIQGEEGHKRAKLRFDYLHAKLAHIKGLVSEYDKTLTSANIQTGDGGVAGAAPGQQNNHRQHSDNNYFTLNNGIDGDYSSSLSTASASDTHHLANGGNY